MENRPQALWNKCLDIIKGNVSQQQYENLFANITCLQYNAAKKKVTLGVPSNFIQEYLEEHYLDLLSKVLSKVYGEGIELWYQVVMDKTNNQTINIPSDKHTPSTPIQPTRTGNEVPTLVQTPRPQELESHLIPKKNFDNFVEGLSNRLPRTIGEAIAEQPNQSGFNPLFIFGESGVGKTHLVNAIGTKIKELHPEKKVLYISAHLFQVQFVNAIQKNHTNDFIYFYQNIDVLIVDDIQEFAGLNKTQDAFFHVFNHLIANGKKLILTSDRPPVDLQGMKDRLLTRFKGGMLAELERPNKELRKDILKEKVAYAGLNFPENVIDFIADNVSENVRELEGIVNSLMAYSVNLNKNVDINLAEQVLKRVVKIEKRAITVDVILEKVCGHYNISHEDVFTSSRKRAVVQVRQISMFLAQKYTKLPSARIGTLIGKRDHATVLHSCTTVENRMKVDKVFRQEIEGIEETLSQK